MARRKRDSGGGGGGEGANWMDTYGDMVTLLLTFFVLLYSFSTIDAVKWKSLVGAFSGNRVTAIEVLTPEMAMERPIDLIERTSADPNILENTDEFPPMPSADDDEEGRVREWYNFLELVQALQDYAENKALDTEFEVDYDAYTVTARFKDNIFFDSGYSRVRPDAVPVLDEVAEMMGLHQHYVSMLRVEGHTDTVPISTSEFPSNWELSTSRASNALRHIIETGKVDKTKIMAGGYGEEHPVATNETAEGRASNRRVDFVFEAIKTR